MGLPQLLFFGVDLVPFAIGFINFYALYLAISVSLNLEFGMAGIPNFGKVLFVAGGAAFAASISGRLAAYVLGVSTRGDFIVFNTSIILEVNTIIAHDPLFAVEMVVVSLAIAGGIGAILGFAASYPALRLREDYLGMLLLGSAQFFQIFLRSYEPLIGGVQNIAVPDPYIYWISVGTGYRDLVAAIVVSVFAIFVFIYAERVAKSPLARTLRAIRENEDAARALGKNDAAFRRKILVVSSAIAGMAGALFTFYIASAEYTTWTRFAWTFWPFLIVIIGGAGNNVGVALGAFIFALLYRGIEQIQPYLQPFIFFDANWLNYLLLSGLLIAILMLRPEGIVRERSAPTLAKSRLRAIASSFGAATNESEGEGGAILEKPSRAGRIVSRLKALVGRKKTESSSPK